MYCSNCGTQIKPDLNYCNRCGYRIAADTDRANVAETLSSTLGYVAGSGFISFIFVALVLVKNGIPGNQIIPIAFFYFGALFAICFLILRQTELLSKKVVRQREQEQISDVGSYAPPADTNPLKELREPSIGSVVEQTTRTLDQVRIERR